MKSSEILVDNIKCGGCANNVQLSLKKIAGVGKVDVQIEEGKVTLEYDTDETKTAVLEKLASLGYPEQGTSTLVQKGKSYVSCMIGRVQS